MEKVDLNASNGSNSESNINYYQTHKNSLTDLKTTLDKPPIALSIGEINLGQTIYDCSFATFGEFSCITGASKSRKTFLKSLVLAGFIGSQSSEYLEKFKTHRTTNKYILDFDTEQSDWYAQRTFKRTLKIVGKDYEHYKTFRLRKMDYKERLAFIDWCILSEDSPYYNEVGFVSVDGYADLVKDVNDLVSCNELVAKMMKWTDIGKCHLTGILHQNYGSNKATGHLGSAIMKKAETVASLEVEESDKDLTNVSFPYTRGFPIDDFCFRINDKGIPVTEEKI